MPRNGNKAAREQRKWKANQKYVETHGKWIINTSHKFGSVRPIDFVSRNPDRLRKFESKEEAVAFEEECHQEAKKRKAAGEDWSQYRYIPRKQLTIQAEPLEESGKPRGNGELVAVEQEMMETGEDGEDGEESEMDSQHDFQECRTSPTKPRWLDELTEIPSEESNMAREGGI